ncbi:unnamed protein product [Mytilus edulis]|uniref:B30.2/SPRY domain-containing protein n=1 Tax=Mytilus edulis TaxID=6550 RepID=A0A8S3SGZ0_MYTED|nr:unnamed protein product [Mytilus edulis]
MAAPDNIYLELPEKKVSTTHRNLPDPPVGAGVSDIYLKPPQRRSIVQRLSFRSKSGDLNKHRLLCIIGAIAGLFFVGLTVGLITKWTCDTNDDVNPQCLWSAWSFWTVCSPSTIFGKQYRFRKYYGPEHSCHKNETIEDKDCADDQYKFDLTFDQSTLHRYCYLSSDNKVISNHFSDETNHNPNDANQLQNYTGAIGNTCLDKNSKIYFEISFQYEIFDLMDEPHLLLEVALAERNKIDTLLLVGDKSVGGWSLNIYSCPELRKICLSVQHGNLDSLKFTLSSHEAGSTFNESFGFLVDRERDEFSFIRDGKIFFTFQNIDSNERLCLIFGVFNPSQVKVSQKIMTSKNYTGIFNLHWT